MFICSSVALAFGGFSLPVIWASFLVSQFSDFSVCSVARGPTIEDRDAGLSCILISEQLELGIAY